MPWLSKFTGEHCLDKPGSGNREVYRGTGLCTVSVLVVISHEGLWSLALHTTPSPMWCRGNSSSSRCRWQTTHSDYSTGWNGSRERERREREYGTDGGGELV